MADIAGRVDRVLDAVPSAVLVTAGLLGGFVAGQRSDRREAAGAVFGVCGALAARSWRRSVGPVGAAALSSAYTGAMGVSHPLAKRVGPWPAVLLVTAGVAAAAAAADTRR